MKKIIAVSLLVCLSITLVFTTALAQEEQEPVFVFPYFDEYVVVSPGQEVVLWTGLVTCTRGQAVSFLNSVHLEWELDGEPLFSSDEEVAEFWFPIRPWDGPPGCISAQGRQSWFDFWGYSLYFDEDEVGTHCVFR
jgi:hypothetical protein